MTLCFQCCHRLRRLWLSPPLHDPALKRRIHLARLGRCRPHHQCLRPHPSLPPFYHTRQVQEHQVRARHPQQAGLPHCRLLQHCALCCSHLTVHLPRHRRRLQVGSPFPLLLLIPQMLTRTPLWSPFLRVATLPSSGSLPVSPVGPAGCSFRPRTGSSRISSSCVPFHLSLSSLLGSLC